MRYLLYTLLAVACLAIAGVTFLIVAAPTDYIRDQAVALVKQHTGRDLVVRGGTSFSLFPNLGVEIDNVALSAPPEMAGAPLVDMEKLKVVVPLVPLLRREIRVERFILVRPTFELRVDRIGRKSWAFDQLAGAMNSEPARAQESADDQDLPPELREFIANSKAKQKLTDSGVATAAKNGAVSGINGLKLGDVRIIDGRILYKDERSGAREVVDKINVNLSLEDLAGPLEADGQFVWGGEVVPFSAQIASLRDVLEARPTKLSVSVTPDLLRTQYDGSIRVGDDVMVDGQVKAAGPSLHRLAQWLGGALPNTPGYQALSLAGHLTFRDKIVALDKANLVVGSLKGTGRVSADIRRSRPFVRADLAIETLVIDDFTGGAPSAGRAAPRKAATGSDGIGQLIEAQGETGGQVVSRQVAGAGTAGSTANGWDDTPIDIRALRAFDAEARLQARQLIFNSIKTGPADLRVTVKSGVLDGQLDKFGLYGGGGRGTVQLDARRSVPQFSARFDLTEIAARPFLKDAAEFDRLGGKGNLNIDLAGRGRSQRELVSALTGGGQFSFNDGAIVGVNIPQIMRGIGQGQFGGWEGSETQKTDFSSLTGSYVITKGIVSNKDLNLVGPLIRLTGAGVIDLPQKQINYRARPKLVASLEGQGSAGSLAGLEVPVLITGRLDDPKVTPDLAGVLQDPTAALNTVKSLADKLTNDQSVQDTIKQLKKGKGVDKLLKGLFGSQGG